MLTELARRLQEPRITTTALDQAWYDYNNPAYAQSTTGTDVDTEYLFSHVPKSGPYRGSETYFPGSSASSLFKYSRFQAEYDF